jgi:hypothetical protein
MSTDNERIGYDPAQLPEELENLVPVLQEELWKLQNVLDYIQRGYQDILHVEPTKRREMMVVAADGTDWDPGHGKGLYIYKDGAWRWFMAFGDVWSSVPVPATSLTTAAANTPDFQKFRDDGSASTGVYAWHFDDNSLEQAFFEIVVPLDYKVGTDLDLHFHWSPATTNTGNVYFGVEYTMQNIDGVFPSTTITMGTAAADGVAKKHQIVSSVLLDGTNVEPGAHILFRVWRDGADAADTLTGDAVLLSAHINYKMNGFSVEAI